REIDRHTAEKHNIDSGTSQRARRANAHFMRMGKLALRALGNVQRGKGESDPGRNDSIELMRKDLGDQRRRGVANACPPAANSPLTGLALHFHGAVPNVLL